MNVATPTLLREKEAREVYALLKCSDNEYDKALDMVRQRAAGDSSIPTGPHGSKKVVLAAGALQHLLPTPKRPPRSSNFHSRGRMLAPGTSNNRLHNTEFLQRISVAIAPILYGLVHLLAWSDQFPTPLERQLWRISSFVVTCSGLVEVFMVVSAEWLEERCKTLYGIILGLILVVSLAYVLASGFLIVESIRQLFFLDDAAYELPAWSNYWPHFS